MDIQSKRDEIQALIDNIKEHSDRLKSSKSLPLLELSVILSKITKLHEKTLILKYIAAVEQNHEEEEFGVKPIFLKKYSDEEEEEDDLEESTQEIKQEVVERKVEVEPEEEVIKEERNESTSEETVSPEAADIGNSHDEISLEEIESKQELEAKPDLNEAFTEEEDPSLSGQLKKQPIQDLLTAIGLNERYLYANELFDGDIEDFKEVIRKLNEFEDGSMAKTYFNGELQSSYGWEKDNPMVKALYLLVERRYH